MRDRQTGRARTAAESGGRESGVPEPGAERDSLMRLLGGRTSALDASLPPVLFGLGWYLGGESIAAGGAAAVAVGAVLGGWRLRNGARPLAVLVSLLAVLLGAVIALYTGNAADFFLARLVTNAVSALMWMVSIAARWPLLGVVVGTLLGQGRTWRRDPALLRAYSLASWVWVGQYVVRLLVFIPLWLGGAVLALSAAQAILTWPLVAVCIAVSWWVLRRALPADHAGIRHPRVADEPATAASGELRSAADGDD
ncbi:DUF3159 domain-containing protein [Saccharopolyspora sp. NPDC002578]